MLEPQAAAAAGDSSKSLSLINEILVKMPSIIKLTEEKKSPDAIDICLMQESVRFNRLISCIEKSLKDLVLAIKGEAIMTESLEKTFISLTLNQVPK